jgi:hypothetical protein
MDSELQGEHGGGLRVFKLLLQATFQEIQVRADMMTSDK